MPHPRDLVSCGGIVHVFCLCLWPRLSMTGLQYFPRQIMFTNSALIGLGAATLNYGQPISVAAARRMACEAKVIPVVLGGESEPLDVGRAIRTVPMGIRRALVARDRGCAFPGSDRPPGLCEAHHCQHWIDGGVTAVHNCCLLCPAHHQQVHPEAGTSPSTADVSNSDHPQSSTSIAEPSPTHFGADHHHQQHA
jgi:hypothetical protein